MKDKFEQLYSDYKAECEGIPYYFVNDPLGAERWIKNRIEMLCEQYHIAAMAQKATPARPTVDHSLLSPSGHVSKRSREAALERTRRELFGDGLAYPSITQPTKVESLRQQAARLRDLAERGMKPGAYRKQAERLEAEAERLAAGRPAQITTGGTDDGQSQDQEGARVEQAQGLERPQEVLSAGGQHDAR